MSFLVLFARQTTAFTPCGQQIPLLKYNLHFEEQDRHYSVTRLLSDDLVKNAQFETIKAKWAVHCEEEDLGVNLRNKVFRKLYSPVISKIDITRVFDRPKSDPTKMEQVRLFSEELIEYEIGNMHTQILKLKKQYLLNPSKILTEIKRLKDKIDELVMVDRLLND